MSVSSVVGTSVGSGVGAKVGVGVDLGLFYKSYNLIIVEIDCSFV